MKRNLRNLALVGAVLVGGVSLTACAGEDTSALGQIQAGQTVYVDLWDEAGDGGDEALAEQKPSGLWVIDTSVAFRHQREGNFDVQVRLNKETGSFEVLDMGTTKVGKDHDNCLSLNDHEHYALMKDTSIEFEKDAGPGDNANDDCIVQPEGTR